MPYHPGEVCFPGGRWQEKDEDLYATALRELQEELGIPSSRVQLQSAMRIEETATGFMIQPWLASIDSIDPYSPDPNEVAEVLQLPMKEVKNSNNYQEVIVNRYGLSFTSCQYIASAHFIWGATARIMKQLVKEL
ncbi:MutT/nudix family transporter protein [Legionella lansingensis]|uniref:MutT/nudix family transporter protein n=2 Tax=Legionella lansingensis TaxID=45067 RepID=A0A0W0VJK7_9GAMM|nr:MutT/nudix family transporter protein [Legionella lansingensis]SNV50358.1 MutT/nudix family transporter protein [Legionella lansingensis]